MAELHYAFIKNNVVEQVAVFASQDEELADRVAQEQGYDDAVWVGENPPNRFSSYNSTTKTFTKPTEDYLYERGMLIETSAMAAARLAAEEAAQSN